MYVEHTVYIKVHNIIISYNDLFKKYEEEGLEKLNIV